MKLRVVKDWTKPSGIIVEAGTELEVSEAQGAQLVVDYPGVFNVEDVDEDKDRRPAKKAAPEDKAVKPEDDKADA